MTTEVSHTECGEPLHQLLVGRVLVSNCVAGPVDVQVSKNEQWGVRVVVLVDKCGQLFYLRERGLFISGIKVGDEDVQRVGRRALAATPQARMKHAFGDQPIKPSGVAGRERVRGEKGMLAMASSSRWSAKLIQPSVLMCACRWPA